MPKTRAQLDREIAAHMASHHVAQGGMVYREIGGQGEPWPSWVTGLKSASGAYAIRDASTKRVLYVGSSNGKLYDTLTRHFQTWTRQKKFWEKAYAGGKAHDPGVTYPRGRCEVAVRIMHVGDPRALETSWIKKLQPKDNEVLHPDGDDAPF